MEEEGLQPELHCHGFGPADVEGFSRSYQTARCPGPDVPKLADRNTYAK